MVAVTAAANPVVSDDCWAVASDLSDAYPSRDSSACLCDSS